MIRELVREMIYGPPQWDLMIFALGNLAFWVGLPILLVFIV